MNSEPLQVIAIIGEGGYGARATVGVMRYAREHQHWDMRKAHRSFDIGNLKGLRPRGVIGQFGGKQLLHEISGLGIPIVNISGAQETKFPLVTMDNLGIGKMAAEHFLDRGYTHLYCLADVWTNYSQERALGFAKRAKAEEVTCEVVEMQKIAPDRAVHLAMESALGDWMASLPRPCGVFLAYWGADMVGPVVRSAKVRVPEDVAILVVGDDPVRCENDSPSLSCVDYPAEQIGYQAAKLLDELMGGKRAPAKPILLAPSGVTERESTSGLAVNDAEVVAAARFIRANACRGIRVDDVVGEIPISRRTLERRFRKAMGRSMLDEIQKVQMEQVKYLLSETDLPLALVAKRSGLVRAQRLCNVFKDETGMTPRQYRMRYQAKE